MIDSGWGEVQNDDSLGKLPILGGGDCLFFSCSIALFKPGFFSHHALSEHVCVL